MKAEDAEKIPWFRYHGIKNGGLKRFMRGSAVAGAIRAGHGWPKWYEPLRSEPERETIVAVAVQIPIHSQTRVDASTGRKIYPEHLTMSAPEPARHVDVIVPLEKVLGRCVLPEEQGFLTSTGRYVGRVEALCVVLASTQNCIEHPNRNDRELQSEDLW